MYNSLLQYFTHSWADYLKEYPDQGREVKNLFEQGIYSTSGIILFIVTTTICLLYYFYFNRRFGNYYSKIKWLWFMFLAGGLVTMITWVMCYWELSNFFIPTSHLCFWLSMINLVYSLILFFISSLVCQGIASAVRKAISHDLSPMGSRTPF